MEMGDTCNGWYKCSVLWAVFGFFFFFLSWSAASYIEKYVSICCMRNAMCGNHIHSFFHCLCWFRALSFLFFFFSIERICYHLDNLCWKKSKQTQNLMNSRNILWNLFGIFDNVVSWEIYYASNSWVSCHPNISKVLLDLR